MPSPARQGAPDAGGAAIPLPHHSHRKAPEAGLSQRQALAAAVLAHSPDSRSGQSTEQQQEQGLLVLSPGVHAAQPAPAALPLARAAHPAPAPSAPALACSRRQGQQPGDSSGTFAGAPGSKSRLRPPAEQAPHAVPKSPVESPSLAPAGVSGCRGVAETPGLRSGGSTSRGDHREPSLGPCSIAPFATLFAHSCLPEMRRGAGTWGSPQEEL